MRPASLPSLLVVAVLACDQAPDPAAARQAIMDADRAFARATADSGVAGWVSHFADDGVQFRSGGTVSGHAGIRELMAPVFADTNFSLTWEPVTGEVSLSGDLGYTVGRYQSGYLGAGDSSTVSTGSYVTIWRRQPDGSWKVALDIGNPDER
jgi:ketosteroid isomerase-like protein